MPDLLKNARLFDSFAKKHMKRFSALEFNKTYPTLKVVIVLSMDQRVKEVMLKYFQDEEGLSPEEARSKYQSTIQNKY